MIRSCWLGLSYRGLTSDYVIPIVIQERVPGSPRPSASLRDGQECPSYGPDDAHTPADAS